MRPIWTGAISFGLIHIPVKLFAATRERTPKFGYVRKKDLCPIGYAKICKSTGEEVTWEEIAKGYQYEQGDIVLLTDEDFKAASPEKSNIIQIEEFVDADKIDPIYFVKPYYIGPDRKSDKVYTLLLEAIKRSGKVGIGKFVLKTKEQLVGLKAEKNMLVLDIMRFKEEIRKPTDEVLAKKGELSEKELMMAIKLIEHMSGPFRPEKYHDTYSEELEELIEKKRKGKKVYPKKTPAKGTKVPDLMNVLRASLESMHKTQKASKESRKVKA